MNIFIFWGSDMNIFNKKQLIHISFKEKINTYLKRLFLNKVTNTT